MDSATVRSIILGTSGHIDHGKTALVKALTGIDTDRLKEEKRRGITIELGFAQLRVNDLHFGIVDVPGHERFIKSMVAGAGGIDIVILVIAADEGVMPQTKEHLDICSLLGVQHGLVALTKVDLVNSDWLNLVTDEIKSLLKGTFLENSPIVPCSATTKEGLQNIIEALINIAQKIPLRDPIGLLRLPLDRVFSMKGFGTVITGTLICGTVRTGEEIVVLPKNVKSIVRRIQVHNQTVNQAIAGQRTAINLGGVDRQDIVRGEVLVHPNTLTASTIIDSKIQLLKHIRHPLPSRTKVLFHLGTRQQEATCVLLGSKELLPGHETLSQLRFDQPVVALPKDRFILRSFVKQTNYGTTIGGGEVVKVLSHKIKTTDKKTINLLQKMIGATPRDRLELEVLAANSACLTLTQLQKRLPLQPSKIKTIVDDLLSKGILVLFDHENYAVIHNSSFSILQKNILQIVDKYHKDHPVEPGISKEELRSRLGHNVDPRLFFSLLTILEKNQKLIIQKAFCHIPNHKPRTAAASLQPLVERIAHIFEKAKLGPPREAELVEKAGAPLNEIQDSIKLLFDEKQLLKISNLLFWRPSVETLEQQLRSFLTQNETITPSQFKALVGQTRKFTIPLAEYFDAQKVTLRVGDLRKLRK